MNKAIANKEKNADINLPPYEIVVKTPSSFTVKVPFNVKLFDIAPVDLSKKYQS